MSRRVSEGGGPAKKGVQGVWGVEDLRKRPAPGFGGELNYASISANVSITATTEAAPNDIVSVPARTYDGTTTIMVTFSSAIVAFTALGSANVLINLWDMDGPTNLGRLAQMQQGTLAAGSAYSSAVPFERSVRLTPSAGRHTYRVRAWRDLQDAVLYSVAGYLPTFLRVVRVG